MFKALGNIRKIPELRRKLLITLGILAICRLGVFMPLPGVNVQALAKEIERIRVEGGLGAFLDIADLFAGGALSRASILALGIMPYITASIIFQMLVAIVPALEKIAREGESGRKRITQYTRYAAIGICAVQSLFIINWLLRSELVRPDLAGMKFYFIAALTLTAGSAFLMWLGEQIDEFGIGSGISLIIMGGIVAQMPSAVGNVFQRFDPRLGSAGGDSFGPDKVLVLAALFIAMIVGVAFISLAQRRVPMSHARRTREGFSARSYLPLKVDMSGVIAIIFAQSIMMIPLVGAYVQSPFIKQFLGYFQQGRFFYTATYMLLIIFFEYFYTAIVFRPFEQAEQFKQSGAFIPGIRPGQRTAEYLERIMNRITLVGGVSMAFIAVVPQIIQSMMNVAPNVASFFGGTGLLITVGVALDIVQRIESYMQMQAYEGLLGPGGKPLRGRR